MRNLVKMVGISIATIFGLIIIVVVLFLNFSPQFGKGSSKNQKLEYAKVASYVDGKFVNQNPTIMDIHYWDLLMEMINGATNRKPETNIPVEKIDIETVELRDLTNTKVTWFGHSTFLIEIDGKIILIDPMLGDSPSPLPIVGAKRYSNELPIEIDKLNFIDAVIFSHDHYDHLDYESIKKLKGKVGQFFMPLGVGNHLKSWCIPSEKLNELYWWNSIDLDGITLTCTPSRHFSGRGLFDRATTLWCSWVIEGNLHNIYFSGDSGYDTHFKEIGEKYGPFDIALMECGQYHNDWKLFHMMPEETAQAAIDLKSKLALPIHWGAFTLALHSWTDPIERITRKAKELDLPITTPKIGETIILGDTTYPITKWWLNYVND